MEFGRRRAAYRLKLSRKCARNKLLRPAKPRKTLPKAVNGLNYWDPELRFRMLLRSRASVYKPAALPLHERSVGPADLFEHLRRDVDIDLSAHVIRAEDERIDLHGQCLMPAASYTTAIASTSIIQSG